MNEGLPIAMFLFRPQRPTFRSVHPAKAKHPRVLGSSEKSVLETFCAEHPKGELVAKGAGHFSPIPTTSLIDSDWLRTGSDNAIVTGRHRRMPSPSVLVLVPVRCR